MASGRRVALEVDRFLGGSGELALELGPRETPVALGRVEGFASLGRLEPVPPESGLELEAPPPGLGPERARQEADRCLRCDLRLGYRSPQRPPARATQLPLTEASLPAVPADEGVVRFFDEAGEVVEIVGGPDMRAEVAERLGAERAASLDFEACPMFTQRQNELLARFLEQHGRMPPGAGEEDDLDELF